MELKVDHCPGCGNVYQINMRQLCAACQSAEDSQLLAIESQLKLNRRLNNTEVAELTGIRPERIRSWIRKGKIKLYDYPNLADQCDLCAEPIRKGKLCVSCAMRIRSDVEREFERERQQKEKNRVNSYYFKK